MAGKKRSPRQSGRRPDIAGKFGRREAILVLLFIALGVWGVAALVARVARNGEQGDRAELLDSGGRKASGVTPGRHAPDFTIQTADGASFRLSQQRGRVVVLDFLAPG